MVQMLEQFTEECAPIKPKRRAEPAREIVYRVRGEVRFRAHYLGLADYRVGHRIRVLMFRGQPCDEVVQVRFGRLGDLVVTGS